MKNREIADMFSRLADALEIRGESGFKIAAYRKAGRILEGMTEDIETVNREGRLDAVPGIGSGTAEKIREYIETGRIAKVEDVLKGVPAGLLDLLEIQGLGGKTIRLMREGLGIAGLDDLRRVADDGSLAGLRGMGDKKVANIKKGIEAFLKGRSRIPLQEAALISEDIAAYMSSAPGIGKISSAGSLRRMKETVGDIDILVSGRKGREICKHFAGFPGTVRVLACGDTKGSIIVRAGKTERQVDLRIVEEAAFGAALLYFTGSKDHNVRVRALAKEKGLKISEYGVFRGSKRIAGKDENECYEALGMDWIPPEMREDRGEVELAMGYRLPGLIEVRNIKGDLHVHTKASDGDMSIDDLVKDARELGYAYIAVCDHSRSAKYAHGLTAARLLSQGREIDRVNRPLKDFRVLKGIEVDILADGSLDFPDDLLGRLDFVVAAIHSGFRKNVTERIVKALKNPHVRVLAHPTGRLISRREGYDVDVDRIIEAAARHGKALELNCYPDRLDLDEFNLRKAREKGVRVSLGTDAHFSGGLETMRFGVGIARRAWLGKTDVLNVLGAQQVTRRKIP